MTIAAPSSVDSPLSDALLRRLDVPGPRYTSYPTADRFVEAFGPAEYRQALRQRAQGAVVGGAPPLSLYVHIPFCESVCYYCACNKVVTRHHERAAEYLDALEQEIALHAAALGTRQRVTQLHFGGGTPTVPLALELLSPAHRPIQLTSDLPGFWRGSWALVRLKKRWKTGGTKVVRQLVRLIQTPKTAVRMII